MTQRSLATLIAVNVILIAALVLVMFGSPQPASAQFGAAGRYLMIAGKSPQRDNQAAVYVIDVTSGKIIAGVISTAARKNQIQFIAGRDIKDDIERAKQMKRSR